MEIDATDPWVIEYLERQNANEPPLELERGDVQPAGASPTRVEILARSIDLLREVWPEMAAESLRYVRLIVPFRSGFKESFSNTIWQGAIFLREDVSDEILDFENLVHEASHQRLNIILACTPLHEAPFSVFLPSPFRSGKRPVAGLIHGVFVYLRVCRALLLAAHATGDARYVARIPTHIEKIRQGLAILANANGLTPAGHGFQTEMREAEKALSEEV